jgi:uncharacterized protein YuzE
MAAPTSIRWTDHALVKATMLGLTRADLEAAVCGTSERPIGGSSWAGSSSSTTTPTHAMRRPPASSRSGAGASLEVVKIDGHYDAAADIAWLRFEGYEPGTVVAEEVPTGLREIDPETGRTIGLEYWNASQTLPEDFLAMLPPPQLGVAA